MPSHTIVFLGLLPLSTAAFAVVRGGERPRPAFWLFSILGSAFGGRLMSAIGAERADLPILVTADWLRTHLAASDVVILDASVLSSPRESGGLTWLNGRGAFDDGHIPGSRFADVIDQFSERVTAANPLDFTRPTAEHFENAARALGISRTTRVVVYDRAIGTFAARLWWLFRSNGHERVAVLDGGLLAWSAAGHALETGPASSADAGDFVADPQPGYFIERAEVHGIATGALPGTLVCALPPENAAVDIGFRGRAGRIPGSVAIPAFSLVDRDTRTLQVDGGFAGIAREDGPVVTYCGGGIAASLNAFALVLDGYPDVQVYDGSLNEWVQDPAAPLVVGA